MEVMGLMPQEFVDEYIVRVVDVFTMWQSGTGVRVQVITFRPICSSKLEGLLIFFPPIIAFFNS